MNSDARYLAFFDTDLLVLEDLGNLGDLEYLEDLVRLESLCCFVNGADSSDCRQRFQVKDGVLFKTVTSISRRPFNFSDSFSISYLA